MKITKKGTIKIPADIVRVDEGEEIIDRVFITFKKLSREDYQSVVKDCVDGEKKWEDAIRENLVNIEPLIDENGDSVVFTDEVKDFLILNDTPVYNVLVEKFNALNSGALEIERRKNLLQQDKKLR